MSDIVERLRSTNALPIIRPTKLEREAADEIERLRGLLTRIHGIAAEPRPVNMAVRLENIACIASGERDATSAQLAEAQRFSHSAPAGCNHFPGQVNCEWCTEPERATQPVEPKP